MSIKERLKEFWNDNKEEIIAAVCVGAAVTAGAVVGIAVGKYVGFYNGATAMTSFAKTGITGLGTKEYSDLMVKNTITYGKCNQNEKLILDMCAQDFNNTIDLVKAKAQVNPTPAPQIVTIQPTMH